MIENLRAEMSFEVRHQEFNDVFTLESITKTSFSDCQKHEDITVGWTDKDSFFSVFIFSIIRGLISYVFIIDIYIWSFIINKNNNIHLLEHCCHLRPLDFDLPPSSVKWHCRVANQICRSCYTLLLYSYLWPTITYNYVFYSFIISVCLIMNVESFAFLYIFFI